jgi:peptide-methionine (S)-S-oxide reductase
MSDESNREKATFGGGCFWCIEAVFQQLEGVESVVSGYAGGEVPNPTYQAVCTGSTGHTEVVQITFDPDTISYKQLLDVFWRAHDPTTLNRQGNDVGTQYRSAIYYHSEQQKETAMKSVEEAQAYFPEKIVTEIAPLDVFYGGEDYHQDYYVKHKEEGYCSFVIRPKLEKLGLKS